MNNLMCLLVLFSLLLFGCSNNQTTNISALNSETKEQQKQIKSGVVFVADTTICNRFFLDNYKSIDNYFGNNSDIKLVERLRSSPVAVFSNNGNNEYLIAYQYEGSTKNAFSCFEIGRLSELQIVTQTNITQIGVEKFYTESGLQLGQSVEEVKQIKGNDFTETKEENETTISYKIEDGKSNFLNRYNMPSYFLRITFDKTDKAKKIIFGFDYP